MSRNRLNQHINRWWLNKCKNWITIFTYCKPVWLYFFIWYMYKGCMYKCCIQKSLLSIICHGPHSTDIPFTMITFWNQWLTAGFGHVSFQIRMKFFKNNNFQFWTFIINLLLIVPLKEFFSYPLFLNKLLMIKLLLGICWFSYL